MKNALLAYLPSPDRGVWMLGPVPIRAYALCIIVGIVVAVWLGDRRWQARGGLPGQVGDIAIWAVPLPMAAMIVGWVFTEMGRQPWLVFGLLKTADGVSPNVTGLEVLISLVVFTLIYGSLAVVEFRLIKKVAQEGPAAPAEVDAETGEVKHEVTVY